MMSLATPLEGTERVFSYVFVPNQFLSDLRKIISQNCEGVSQYQRVGTHRQCTDRVGEMQHKVDINNADDTLNLNFQRKHIYASCVIQTA